MQFHDITRQQVEHIYEALERLSAHMVAYADGSADADDDSRRALVIEAGDVCELQEAQLRFASAELYTAVRTIVDNLRDVAAEQSRMASETRNVAGGSDSSGSSFVDAMKQGMTTVTGVLLACDQADREMSDTMQKVAGTIGEITGFVSDIEYIGSEIDLIAINAQIKAAHTGPEGAALGVLAQAIKRLSDESVHHTGSVASILNKITTATRDIVSLENEDAGSANRIALMQEELGEIMQTLGVMNAELNEVLSGLGGRVAALTEDVERTTGKIDVHELVKRMADDLMVKLDRIVTEARQIEPASTEFKQNLQHMEQRYTMDSERHIHEAIARKRGVKVEAIVENKAKSVSIDDSGFGDNVDLF
jgi:methyl-accepting chemotaxis protein